MYFLLPGQGRIVLASGKEVREEWMDRGRSFFSPLIVPLFLSSSL